MIGILVALKDVLTLEAVAVPLSALDAGLNVATFFSILKSKISKDSVEYQIIIALDKSLFDACEQLGWEYDMLAVSQEIQEDTILKDPVMTRDRLGNLLEILIGVEVDDSSIDTFIDCFDKNIAENGMLYRYLTQKWMRYIGEERQSTIKTPISLSFIPSSINLIGREKDIRSVKECFENHSVILLRADGGVGKTAFASKLINEVKEKIVRNESQFEHIAWITSTGDLRKDLSKLRKSAITSTVLNDNEIDEILIFLQQNPTFIVIDNMDTKLSGLEISILNTIAGVTKILITTRVKIKKFKEYPLKQLDETAAIQLFYRHYLDISHQLDWEEIEERTDIAYVENIVEASTRNALLVELIAKMACWEYVERLDALWVAVEKNIFGIDSVIDIEMEDGDSKLQTHIKNLYKMSRLSDSQQELMRFFAIFPAETVIFTDAFKWAGFTVQDLKYLTDFGWIDKAGEGYLIHTMVKGSLMLQDRQFDIEKYMNLIEALSITDQYVPFFTTSYIKTLERIVVPDTVCSLLKEKNSHDEIVATLLCNIADVYIRLAVINRLPEVAYRIFNSIGIKLPGESKYKKYLDLYGMRFYDDHIAKALEYYEQVRIIREDILGPDHPNTIKVIKRIEWLRMLNQNNL